MKLGHWPIQTKPLGLGNGHLLGVPQERLQNKLAFGVHPVEHPFAALGAGPRVHLPRWVRANKRE